MDTRITNQRILLARLIEAKTVLKEGEHFRFAWPRNTTRARPNLDEFVICNFIKKCNLSMEERREMTIIALDELGINYQPKTLLYIKLPGMDARLINLIDQSIIYELNESSNFDLAKKKLLFLSTLHEKLQILGLRNIDQKQLKNGTANFNYLNEKVMNKAKKLFTFLKIKVKIWEEKNCNLTFDLNSFELEDIDMKTVNAKNEETGIDSCIWFIEKIGKKVKKQSETVMAVHCSEIDSIKTKLELEKYGFKITTEKVKSNNFKFTITNSKIETMKEDQLSTNLRKVFRDAKILLLQDRKKEDPGSCIQLHTEKGDKMKISANYGTPEEKKEIILKVKDATLANFPEASIGDGQAGTTITVAIPGFVNPPSVKKTEAPVKKNEEKNPTQEKGLPVSISLNEEQIQQVILSSKEQVIDLVIKKLEKYFLFVSKKNPMVPGLLAFPKSPFSDPEEVKKKLKK